MGNSEPRVVVKLGDREAADKMVGTGVPTDTNATVIVSAPAVVEADGEVVAVLGRLTPEQMAPLRRAFREYPMDTTVRAHGSRNRSRTFGFTGRREVFQRNMCRPCYGSTLAPATHARLDATAVDLAAMYAATAPEQAARDVAAAEVILPEWRMSGTQWTSGVLNLTSPLPYHYDRNNLEPVWSAMIVARRGTRGGMLHVPELGALFECRDGDVIMFPGWRFVHGVTPISKVDADGYRMSAVYYCVRDMARCLPLAEELARARKGVTERQGDLRPPSERVPTRKKP